MKKIAAIVLLFVLITTIFSGCVEEEAIPTPTPTPTPYVYPTPTPRVTTKLLTSVEYERRDWDTTNVGPIDHLIYRVSLFDKDGNYCWSNGHLTLKIMNADGTIVATIERNFTEADIEYESMSHIFTIYDHEVDGSVTDAITYNATYVTIDGETLTEEGEITGPY